MNRITLPFRKVTNVRQVWINAIIVVAFAMIASNALMFIIYPFDLAYSLIWTTPLIAFLIASPPAYYFSTVMLRNYQLTMKLKDLVQRDRLTDVATRDFFFSKMNSDPTGHGVSLMVDIDHFKRVNDTHGHLTGDAVIKMVAGVLKNEVREDDIVCRFGGEEFVIFLHNADAQQGWEVAERMRQNVAESMLALGGVDVRVTISIGGSLKQSVDNIEMAISAADDALYRAKALGRNRTEASWKDEPQARRSLATDSQDSL